MTTIEQRKERAAVARSEAWIHNKKYTRCHDTFIGVAVDKIDDESTRQLFIDTCNFLMRQGFKVNADPEIRRRYPSLSQFHRYARHGVLECGIEWYPAGLKLEFYQNVNIENPNGGKYDFNKLERMPHLLRLRYKLTKKRLLDWFMERGFPQKTECESDLAADIIFNRIKSSGHWDGSDLTEWAPDDHEAYNNRDANKKTIIPGQIKYFYHWKHRRISCGVVYYGLNNMWWVQTGLRTYENVCASDLFDFDPSLPRREVLPTDVRRKKVARAKAKAIEVQDYLKASSIRDYEQREFGSIQL